MEGSCGDCNWSHQSRVQMPTGWLVGLLVSLLAGWLADVARAWLNAALRRAATQSPFLPVELETVCGHISRPRPSHHWTSKVGRNLS
ncbi:hypothetical protein B0T24DRAFT_139125 [Lasiosphaeria ovina]|uniref:Uncharacterized protein n=1 Tax=Lasiosphaeria ovina TaxID=92902 RepID=A0AAE0NCW8_9PEZI|nr:hypothetical protein B0T24DRAFT_139125 [Lasiosphaeria ovina]